MTTSDLEKFFGTPSKAAAFFKVSPEAFYQWRKRPGGLIPKGRAAEAAFRTKGKLKFEPSLYDKPKAQAAQA
ncbi:MAG: Cro/CI family transcriptional regulator [Pantoea sp.]|uniref:Cro/CI family transcriptional regulator n=1 Tax=Pantoea TaxID=53335 RepID=UPI002911E0E7|nr:Cro/CI family transcriptional regulator [Pantoea sp.]MDU6091581.1 Cro/CI family transcriptional regulator [Staphylococcus lugdunensis]MDU6442702.1 Cro/CI family transcriptional regulator [Pantoea sp.]MDU7840623.1 Cro/CI family transcriptional regulator [Pantoea sp.]